ncbi:MAG: ATP-binding protein [Aeromicrobium sp.]|uniref:ATP-binding protein n=1 Tax=Aeromicrobium sp. TaxID=1871063 RepID=UPI00263670F3|nr:ATP-binding protein [Aeromicrobium sp.]MDF1706223.1 ATP-binding protein [Aeromicrobium sp.]
MERVHDVLHFPFARSTPGIARTKLAGFLTKNHVASSRIDDALIVLSEMLTNAVSHGRPSDDGTIEVTWSIAKGLLEISVRDHGEGNELEPIDFDNDSLSGRGLSIISQITDRWWVDVNGGTRVNAELSLDEAGRA